MSISKKQLYFAQCAHHWGVGETIDEAVSLMRKHGQIGQAGYVVKAMPMGIKSYNVDDITGTVTWIYADPNDPRCGKTIKLKIVKNTLPERIRDGS